MAEVELDRWEANQGRLPPICIYCGAQATGSRKKTFLGTTPYTTFWTFKRPSVRMPVCDRHRGFSLRRSLLLLPTFLPFMALLALLAALDQRGGPPGVLAFLLPIKPFIVAAVCLFLVGMVVSANSVFYGDIHCTQLTRGTVTLAGVSERFVEAYLGQFSDADDEVLEALPAEAPRQAPRRTGPGLPIPEAEPDDAGEPDRPRRSRSWLWILAAVVGLLSFSCLGCLLVFSPFRIGQQIRLENPALVRLGPIQELRVDYRFLGTGPDPAGEYYLVLRMKDGRAEERSFAGRDLRTNGSLRFSWSALGFAPRGLGGDLSGPLEVSVEKGSPGAARARRRVSNVLIVN